MAKPDRSTAPVPCADAPAPDEGERRDAFAEIGSDWFWAKDAQLRLAYMSAGIAGQSGALADDFLGKRIDEVRVPGFEEVDWRPLLRLLERRKPFREFRLTR